MKRLVFMAGLAILMFAFTTGAVMAQEKAKAEKEKTAPAQEGKMEWPKPGPNTKVLLENEKVRVTENTYKPGEKNAMQKRGPRVVYVLEGGPTKVYYEDGKTEKSERKKGAATYFPGGDTKSTENVGKTNHRSLIINLSKMK
jgi:mannose-6-phosphate isomerase-like protein (cupin superfamily)